MSLDPALKRYTPISQLFHWTVVLLIVGLLVTDSLREAAPKPSDLRTEWLNLHMSIGILLFLVVIARILWTRLTPQPAPVPGARWTQVAALVAHGLLNLATLLIPIFGYLRVASKGRTADFFGLQLPSLTGDLPWLNDWMHVFHGEPMEVALYALITLHVVAALWHQWIKQDGTLTRMLPWGEVDRTA